MANFNQSPLGQATVSSNLPWLLTAGSNTDLAAVTHILYSFNVDGSGTATFLFSPAESSRPTSGQTWPRYIFSG